MFCLVKVGNSSSKLSWLCRDFATQNKKTNFLLIIVDQRINKKMIWHRKIIAILTDLLHFTAFTGNTLHRLLLHVEAETLHSDCFVWEIVLDYFLFVFCLMCRVKIFKLGNDGSSFLLWLGSNSTFSQNCLIIYF